MSNETRFGIKITYDGKEVVGGVTANRDQLKQFAEEAKRSTATAAAGFDNVGAAAARSGGAAEKAAQQVKQSAKEAAWLGRQLPMQMTDIATGLASGQTPFTVLIQQGGQLKDIYGGIGPAARAVGGYVAGLVNPFTVAAAAAGVLAVAYHQGSREADAMAAAVVMSGNAAGKSVGQLQGMSAAVAAATGATRAAAAEVLTGLVASGKVAGDVLGRVAETALRLDRAGVQAIEDTVKAFEALGKSPVEASLKLNERYGYLTAAVYRQIKALEDQGRADEAAALAQRAYADAMAERSGKIEERLGIIERKWRAIKDAAAGAWDVMLGVGRPLSLDEQVGAAQMALTNARAGFRGKNRIPELEEELRLLLAQKSAEDERSRAAGRSAAQDRAGIDWAKEGDRYLDKRAQMEREIARARELGAAAGVAQVEIERRIAAIRERYADKGRDPDEALADAVLAGRRRNLDADEREIEKRKRHQESVDRARAAMGETTVGLESAYARDNAHATEATMPTAQRDLAESLRQVAERAATARREISHKAAALKDDKAAQAAMREELLKVAAAEEAQKASVRGLWEEQQALNASWQYGAVAALREYAREVEGSGVQTKRALIDTMKQGESAVVSAMRGNKNAVRGFVDFALDQYLRLKVAQPFVGAMAGFSDKLIDKWFGSSSGSDSYSGDAGLAAMASVGGAHSGAIIGAEATFARNVPMSIFEGARRYHTGDAVIGPDEVPIIGKRGEGMFTEGQMRKLAPVDQISQGTSVTLYYAPVIDARNSSPGMLGQIEAMIRDSERRVRTMLIDEANGGGEFAFATGRRS